MEENVVSWFELPVHDMDRAIAFYEQIFEFKIERHQMEDFDMGWFPSNHEAVGAMGSLVKHPDFYTPSHEGPLIYFNSQKGDVQNELLKVENAGGKVLMEKRLISEDVGYMGVLEDTEGNRIALFSKK